MAIFCSSLRNTHQNLFIDPFICREDSCLCNAARPKVMSFPWSEIYQFFWISKNQFTFFHQGAIKPWSLKMQRAIEWETEPFVHIYLHIILQLKLHKRKSGNTLDHQSFHGISYGVKISCSLHVIWTPIWEASSKHIHSTIYYEKQHNFNMKEKASKILSQEFSHNWHNWRDESGPWSWYGGGKNCK